VKGTVKSSQFATLYLKSLHLICDEVSFLFPVSGPPNRIVLLMGRYQ
jgi:hypothetical protein